MRGFFFPRTSSVRVFIQGEGNKYWGTSRAQIQVLLDCIMFFAYGYGVLLFLS